MKKYFILLFGNTVSNDNKLITALEKFAKVFINSDGKQVEKTLDNFNINLILFEISRKSDIRLIQKFKKRYVEIPILVVESDGDIETIIQAYSIGVKDVFIKPYKHDLLVERANALLIHSNKYFTINLNRRNFHESKK